tara:strand:- start:278 stop:1144 length:867 start_codon:yes stop_codon:yes gene_type:complete
VGILSPEATESLGKFLEGGPSEPAGEQSPVEEVQAQELSQEEAPVQNSSSDDAQDVNISAKEEAPETSSSDEGEVEEGHRVPYSRFRQVLDARNKHRDELESYREKMAEIEKERDMLQRLTIQRASEPQVQAKSEEDDWLSSLSGEQGAQPDDPRYSQLKSRLEAQEVALQRMTLEREVAEAQQAYPGVDRDAILKSISEDPSRTAIEAAEQYSSWIAGIEEAAIARFQKEAGQELPVSEAAAPKAPPRPSKSGSASVSEFMGDRKPKTVKEGSALFREFLKDHNPFA